MAIKFKIIVGKPNFSDQFKNIIKRFKRVGYNIDIMRQSSCLVVNLIKVDSCGVLFNCTTVGQASDLMTALAYRFNRLVGVLCLSLAGHTVAQLEVFFISNYL